jgi:hypothetical protein
MGNHKTLVGSTASKFTTIKQQMKELIPEYKALYLYFLYAPELLPDRGIKTYEDLKLHFQMFPKGVTENDAALWLYEEPVQNALKVLMKSKHSQKMVELYNIYFDKAKDDVQSFRAFVDFSNTFFKGNEESELQKILNNTDITEGERSD